MSKKELPSAKIIRFPEGRHDASPKPPQAARSGILSRIVAAIVHFKARSDLVAKVIGLLPRWVTPNAVTVFRGLLIVPIVLLVRDGQYLAALLTLTFAMLLDFVDGAIAHVRDMRSETGAFLDPLADKILVGGVLISTLSELPSWAWVPILAICSFAFFLTVIRVVKITVSKKGNDDVQGVRIAASSAGKMKLLTETASMFLVLGGLSLDAAALILAGMVTLCAAALLGGLSLLSQVRRT